MVFIENIHVCTIENMPAIECSVFQSNSNIAWNFKR